MSSSILSPVQRARQHGAVLQPSSRRDLERAGWRTTLDYRENHVRGLDGRLLRVEPVWTAEAERYDGQIVVASATGSTADAAWSNLRDDIDAAVTRRHPCTIDIQPISVDHFSTPFPVPTPLLIATRSPASKQAQAAHF